MGARFILNDLEKYKKELVRQKEDLKTELAQSSYKVTMLLAEDLNAVITTEINTIRMKLIQIDKIEDKIKKLETLDADQIEKKLKEKAINVDKIAFLLEEEER